MKKEEEQQKKNKTNQTKPYKVAHGILFPPVHHLSVFLKDWKN